MIAKQGIDVSHWQGKIDWDKVKASGIKFAIIKVGGSDSGFYKDSTFEYNYENAKRVGIQVGAYYFVGKKCISSADGSADAKRMIEQVKGKTFELPLFIDIETTSPSDKAGATDAVIAFCDEIDKAGYKSGVYASKTSGFVERLDDSRLLNITHWVAQYNTSCTYKGKYDFWQKSSKGSVNGITGNVDLDEMYVEETPVQVEPSIADTLRSIAKQLETIADKL